jgi:hypothetical protein
MMQLVSTNNGSCTQEADILMKNARFKCATRHLDLSRTVHRYYCWIIATMPHICHKNVGEIYEDASA